MAPALQLLTTYIPLYWYPRSVGRVLKETVYTGLVIWVQNILLKFGAIGVPQPQRWKDGLVTEPEQNQVSESHFETPASALLEFCQGRTLLWQFECGAHPSKGVLIGMEPVWGWCLFWLSSLMLIMKDCPTVWPTELMPQLRSFSTRAFSSHGSLSLYSSSEFPSLLIC